MTLQALRMEVGDDNFFKILRRYVSDYQYGNASTDDFVRIAGEVSGKDLGGFFKAGYMRMQLQIYLERIERCFE